MLKKTIRRLGALAMVLAMAVSVFAVSASAADEATDTNYDVISSFKKTVTVDANNPTTAPTTSFTYEVKKADAQATMTVGNSTFVDIKAGLNNDDVVLSETAFTSAASVSAEYVVNGNISVKKNAYTQPGIYHYTVKEEIPTTQYDGITYDTNTYNLYVFVVTGDNGIEVDKIIMTNPAGTSKVEGFTNDYGKTYNKTHDVIITKNVTGNMGETNKEFKFDIKVTSAHEEYYKVVYSVDGTAAKEQTVWVKSNDATATQVSIMHNGYIHIYGLSENDTYVVTEHDYTADGYETFVKYGDAEKTKTATATAKVTSDNSAVEVENNKTTTSPTGVIMNIAPYALMVVLAGAFAVVFLTRRNRAE